MAYCRAGAGCPRLPDLVSAPVPPELTVSPAYGMLVLTDSPLALRFALFIVSERGQAILEEYGFQPVASTP